MKKEQVIKNYNNFKNGLLIVDRKPYTKAIRESELRLESNIDKVLIQIYFEAALYFKKIAQKTINESIQDKDKIFEKALLDKPLFAHPYELIRQIDFKDNIFVVSNEIQEKLSTIPLPESLKFSELKHIFELPALFIFEDALLVFDKQNYKEDFPYKTVLFNLKLKQKYYPELRVLPDSFDEYINTYEKTKKINDIYKDYYHVVFVIMLLINQKNFQKIFVENNQKITQYKKELEKNFDTKKEKLLSKEKSYNFVDLSLSFDKAFTSSETIKENGTGTKEPHWRSSHWHTYWTGKRDSLDRKKILHFIPEIWIGNPLEIKEANKFKLVK